ncbi:MAG: tryptophan--tRNA ligase [Clostridiales bacterium]|jgi:tryptophanyl-tRNA synthetase|nr:tryptophan--tRNA ligase [Clostridiales bacterium]
MKDRKTIFSGVQPSGNLTLGNYLGALKNFTILQNEYDCIYCVVDLHSLTVRQDPRELREMSYSVLALYIACGIDPDKNILFLQSNVSQHAELSWILNCFTYMGELSRMTQFKDKSVKHEDNINSGLFTYPVLMASDILLYQANMVPIGQDQKQHLELARNVAERFNNIYPDTFVVPEPYIPVVGSRVMSLQDPTAKMSKSDANENNYVSIIDEPDTIIKKFKKAVTDSETDIRYDEVNKPGISNLIDIYGAVKGLDRKAVEKEFENTKYGDFKIAVGTVVAETLTPIRMKYFEIVKDKAYIDNILRKNAQRARDRAAMTLKDVYDKVGLIKY